MGNRLKTWSDIPIIGRILDLVIGIGVDALNVEYLDLTEPCQLILGNNQTGKTNTLRNVLQVVRGERVFLLDSSSLELYAYGEQEKVTYITELAQMEAFIEELKQVVLERETGYKEAKELNPKISPKLYYQNLEAIYIVVDVVQEFIDKMESSRFEEDEAEDIVIQALSVGVKMVVTALLKVRGVNKLGGHLKNLKTGLVLGDIKEQTGTMYLASILQEFHTAQDNSQTIIENDKKDLDLVEEMTDTELLNYITFREQEPYEEEVDPLDLSENYKTNQSQIASLDSKYKSFFTQGNDALIPLKEAGNKVINYNDISTHLNTMGGFKNNKNEYLYSNALNVIKTELSTHNSSLLEKKKNLTVQMNAYTNALEAFGNGQVSRVLGTADATTGTGIVAKYRTFQVEIKRLVTEEIQDKVAASSQTMVEENRQKAVKESLEATVTTSVNKTIDDVVLTATIPSYSKMKLELEVDSKMLYYL